MHITHDNDDFYTLREAARLLRVSEATVWRWVDAERLPAYRVGPRRIRIKREDLDAMVRPAGGNRDDFPQRRGIWAGYDPDRVRKALDAGFGALAGIDVRRLKADLRAERGQRSKGRRW